MSVCVLALAAVPTTAAADWHFTPFIGTSFSGSTTIVDFEGGAERVRTNYGIAVSRIGKFPLGAEALFVYVPGFFEGESPTSITAPNIVSSRVWALMGNVIFATPRQWNEYGLRPFVSGGVGLLHASQRDALRVFPITRHILGYNVGGGATGFVSPATGVRFDVRFFSNLTPSGASGETVGSREHLSYWTASVGVVLRY